MPIGFSMPRPAELITPRLTLRQWRQSDLEPFAAMNADADVMRYYPAIWSREKSDEFAKRVRQLIDERGWGFWAVEERASGRFIGFVGLHRPSSDLPFAPCVEVGWRLAISSWVEAMALKPHEPPSRSALNSSDSPNWLHSLLSVT